MFKARILQCKINDIGQLISQMIILSRNKPEIAKVVNPKMLTSQIMDWSMPHAIKNFKCMFDLIIINN